MLDLLKSLHRLYKASEVNFKISTLWDCPIWFHCDGNDFDGWKHNKAFDNLEDGIKWLINLMKKKL